MSDPSVSISPKTYVLHSKINNKSFDVNHKIIDASILLKNVFDLTEISEPISIDCSAECLETFIKLIDHYEIITEIHDPEFERNLFQDFTDEKLINLVKEMSILDSDFFFNSIADLILRGIKKLNWKQMQEYLGLVDDFTMAEREIEIPYIPQDEESKKDAHEKIVNDILSYCDEVENESFEDKNNEKVEENRGEEEENFYFDEGPNPYSRLIMANGLFIDEKVPLKNLFENMMGEKFVNQIGKIDFTDKIKSVNIINEFVNTSTNGLIDKILEQDSLSPDTSLISINASTFAGKWENSFHPRFKGKFYSNQNTREIDMMAIPELNNHFNFNEGKEWECLGIPFKKRKAWMFIVLPKNKKGLEDLIKTMDYPLFQKCTKRTDSGKTTVTIPLFEISETYDLSENLSKMVFNNLINTRSDLSEMLVEDSKNFDNKAFHKSTIQVDEYGCSASAVIADSIANWCGIRLRKFSADRPFLFFIVSMENEEQLIPKEILVAGTFC